MHARRYRAVAVSLLLTSSISCVPPIGMGRKRARMQAVAERFVRQWMERNHLQGRGVECVFDGRDFNRTMTGWRFSYHFLKPSASVLVSADQELVVSFLSFDHDLRTPQYKDGKRLTREEQVAEVKRRITVPLEKAREHAEGFLAKVYPRFRERDFRFVGGRLWVRPGNRSSYQFCWGEAFDPQNPRAFPNCISVDVNPQSGVIVDYSAENYSLPEDFELAMKPEEAVEKANESVEDRLKAPGLRLVGKPSASLIYLAAKHWWERDRICWFVTYLFEGGFSPKVVGRLFDVTTGERVIDPDEPQYD